MGIQRSKNNPITPGGIFQCRCDTDRTLIHANDSLFHYLGYTREEFQTLFHGKLAGVIYPDDLELIGQAEKEQLKHGNMVAYKSRIICKGGCFMISRGRSSRLETVVSI